MSKKLNKIIIFGIIFGFFIILPGFTDILTPAISKFHHINNDDIILIENYDVSLKTSGFWNITDSPIYIDDSDPNYNWSKTASENDWCSGSGTWIDPYIIENITIDGQNDGYCIEIKNSDVPFIIRNCSLYNSGIINFFVLGAAIKLAYVSNGKILKNNLFNNSMTHGIQLYYSDNNTISGNVLNNNYNGLYISWSNNNTILNNTIENNERYGCYLNWGKNNTISNNNFSSCGFGMDGSLEFVSSHHILTSNLVNKKPIFYYVNNISLSPINFLNAGQVILVNCSNSLVSNINVSYSSCGIGLYYCEENTLTLINSSHCADRGIYLRHSHNNTIYKNIIEWNGHQTLLYNDRGGIVLSLSDYNNITENQAHHNSKGIHMQNSHYNEIIKNFAYENTRSGISLMSSNAYLEENEMSQCGIEILGDPSTYTIDISNQINNKPIYFYKDTTGLIPDDFLNAGQIILVNCDDTEISNVNVSYGSCGIYIYNCNNVRIEECNSSYNRVFGIKAYGQNNIISNNIINHNHENGLEVEGDYYTVISNSIKYNNYYGICLFHCSDGYFIGNVIQNNSQYGVIISIQTCVNNTFFNNYFINNSKHAIDLGSSTHWNSSEIGNFWDNYTGSDLNDDGIGDIPHIITLSPLIRDFLPIWDDGDDIIPGVAIPSYNLALLIMFIGITCVVLFFSTLNKRNTKNSR